MAAQSLTVKSSRRQNRKQDVSHFMAIETQPTFENLDKCNPQSQSPLFSIIPPEIRNHIFSLALTPYEDTTRPYEEWDYCYRPGHRGPRIIATSLLLTCRRVWLEANHWPMEQTTHTFWFDDDRRPPGMTTDEDTRMQQLADTLTRTQLGRPRHLQIFGQMYWLEGMLKYLLTLSMCDTLFASLQTFTVTIRYSDWWNWEDDAPLELQSHWVKDLLRSERLHNVPEFRLELEVLDRKVKQLQPILADLASAAEPEGRFKLLEANEESTWSGPTNLGGYEHQVYEGLERLDYRVVTLRWKQAAHGQAELENKDMAMEEVNHAPEPSDSEDTKEPKQKVKDKTSDAKGSDRAIRKTPLRNCRWRQEKNLLRIVSPKSSKSLAPGAWGTYPQGYQALLVRLEMANRRRLRIKRRGK